MNWIGGARCESESESDANKFIALIWMQSLMMVAHAWWQQRRLDECLVVRMVEMMWAGNIVDGRMLLNVGGNFRRHGNLSVFFCKMKLESFTRHENLPAFCALERRYWRAFVEMNFPFMHHHVAVPRKRFPANITLGGKRLL